MATHPTPPETRAAVDSWEPPASRARLGVLLLLCSMAFILYLDRVCVSQALRSIQLELDLSDTESSYVLMAFTLAYGLFEVPTGHWGDRYGSRRILARIVVWWSIFTALTAACFGFTSLIIVRFLFGAGEAGAYPNAARVIARWFPSAERGRVQGIFQAASLVGGALAPAVAGFLIKWTHWRVPFILFGGLGLAWAALFFWWFRDDPDEHPAVNAAEARLLAECRHRGTTAHPPIPWREVVCHPAIWLLSIAVSCTAFNSYLYFSWYPTYLQKARDVEQAWSGVLSSLVLVGGTLGTLTGGVIVDRLSRSGQLTVATRRAVAIVCLLIAAGLLIASMQADDPTVSALLAALACWSMFSQQTVWWSCACEVSGRFLGSLFGLMNGLGVFGAMSSQYFFGRFADYRKELGFTGREQYDPAFWAFAAALVLGAICWLFINPARVIGAAMPDDPQPAKSEPA